MVRALAIGLVALAVAVGASSAAARTPSTMRLTCNVHAKTTLSRIPASATHFRFSFVYLEIVRATGGAAGSRTASRQAGNAKAPHIVRVRLIGKNGKWLSRSSVEHGRLAIRTRKRLTTNVAHVQLTSGSEGHGRYNLASTEETHAVDALASIRTKNGKLLQISAVCTPPVPAIVVG